MSNRKDVDIRINGVDNTQGFTKTKRGLQSISEQLSKLQSDVKLVAAAFVTFQTAIRPAFQALQNQLTGLFNTGRQFETLKAQFEGLMGSIEAGEQAIGWVDRFAEGVPYQTSQVADAFVKLRAFGIDPTNGSLQALTEQASLLGGSYEKLDGIILAVGQAWSKQKLQGEEILQLVERGVPVWDLLAEATGKNVTELQKLSSKGELGREVIAQLLAEINRAASGSNARLLERENGQIELLSDNWERFQRLVGESGLNTFLTDVFKEINAAFRELRDTGQLQEIAKTISDTIVSIGESLRSTVKFIIEFRDELGLAFKVIAGLTLAAFAAQIRALGAVLLAATKSVYAFTASLFTLRPALLSVQTALNAVAAAFVGWQIGTYLREEFEFVEQAGIALAGGIQTTFVKVRGFFENIPDYIRVAFGEVVGWIRSRMAAVLNEVANFVDLLPGVGSNLAAGLRAAAESVAGDSTQALDAAYDRIADRNAQLKKEIDLINEGYADLFANVGRESSPRSQPNQAQTDLAEPDFGLGGFGDGAGDALLDSEKKRLESQLEQVRRQIAEAEAETLEQRLELIRSEYSGLISDLEKIGDQAGVDSVEKLIAIEQAQERVRFQKETQAEAERQLQDLISTRADLIATINAEQQNGLIQQAEAQERIKQINEDYLPVITQAAEKAKELAAALGDEKALANIDASVAGIKGLEKQVLITGEQINTKLAGGLSNALVQFVDGTKSAKDAFRDFAADFLSNIAQMILQAAILQGLQGAFGFGNVGGQAAGGINALVAHDGAVAGIKGGTRRRVPAFVFDGAPRYHNGGIAGLKPNEVPAILERGETVVPAGQASSQGQGQPFTIINQLESSAIVEDGFSTQGGRRALVNAIRADRSEIKLALGI